MNTNKPSQPDELDLTGASEALAAGLPDPAALARLANELYQAFQHQAAPGGFPGAHIPDTPEAAVSNLMMPAAPPVNVSSLGVSPHMPVSPATPQHLTEAELQAAASDVAGSHLSNAVITSPQSAMRFSEPASPGIPGGVSAADTASPGIPGGVSAADFSVTPSFSFLEQARSLFEKTAAPPLQAFAPTIKIPTETEVRGIAPSLPGHQPTSIP